MEKMPPLVSFSTGSGPLRAKACSDAALQEYLSRVLLPEGKTQPLEQCQVVQAEEVPIQNGYLDSLPVGVQPLIGGANYRVF